MFFYLKNVIMQFLSYKIILPSNYKQTFQICHSVWQNMGYVWAVWMSVYSEALFP